MVGQDPCDSTSLAFPGAIDLPRREDLKGIRLGVPEELTGSGGGVEPGVRENFEATLALAERLGAIVEPCRLPHAPHALSAYYLIAPAEASANLARFDGVRYGLRVDGDGDLDRMYARTRAAGFGPEVKRRIMLGTYALSSGYYDAYYGTAQKVRTKISEDFRDGVRASSTSSSRRPVPGRRSSSGPRRTIRWPCTSTTSARCRCRWPGSPRSRSPPV